MKKILFILFVFCFSTSYSQGWFPVGNGFPNGEVFTLLSYDSVLYAGGGIDVSGTGGIGQWNGITWSPIGKGVNGYVISMIIYNRKLYVGGEFDSAGGKPANGIAVWDGNTWSSVGKGFSQLGVNSLVVYNGELYAGGEYMSLDGKKIHNIARWDGIAWDSVGKGINVGEVDAMQVYMGKLYAGGIFDSAGGVYSVGGLATWDGTKWDSVTRWDSADLIFSDNYGGITSFLQYDSLLYIGIIFGNKNNLYQWNDTSFKVPDFGANYPVNALIEKNGIVYAGGQFDSAGHILANEIAVWNGISWSTLGTGMSGINPGGAVNALAFYKGALYAAGVFDRAGGFNNVNNIAAWGDSTLGIATLHNAEQIKVYPNPNSGKFTIVIASETKQSQSKVEVYNVLGEQVYTSTLPPPNGGGASFTYQINISSQPNGVYLYRITTNKDELIGEGKLVIER